MKGYLCEFLLNVLRAKFLLELLELIKFCLNKGWKLYIQSYAEYIMISSLLFYIAIPC